MDKMERDNFDTFNSSQRVDRLKRELKINKTLVIFKFVDDFRGQGRQKGQKGLF